MPNWNTGQQYANQAPSNPNGGDLWWNGSQLHVFDNANWVPLHTVGATLNASVHAGTVGQGFTYIPIVTGSINFPPNLTGTASGRAAIALDAVNNRILVHTAGSWRGATLAFT